MNVPLQLAPRPRQLDRHSVHVWALPIGSTLADTQLSVVPLSADEEQRAAQFQHEPARRRFVAARVGLRRILSVYLACPPASLVFEYSARGKPSLATRPPNLAELRFNLAHSGDLAIVAIALGCEVGVDVEQLRIVNNLERMAQRYFHPQEVVDLLSRPAAARAAAFLQCWTCKEAVLKAAGSGITGARHVSRSLRSSRGILCRSPRPKSR